jgi:hypothetical protein
MIETRHMAEAMDRIARSADGQMFYRFLQKVLCETLADGASDGALREQEGRRRFAAQLMANMAEGIQDSDRHAITFARIARSDADTRPRGAARRVTADTFVAGYSDPADAGPASDPPGGAAA